MKQVKRKNLKKNLKNLHAANQLDICAPSSETSFIENIEEMLLMSVKKDGDWFGS